MRRISSLFGQFRSRICHMSKQKRVKKSVKTVFAACMVLTIIISVIGITAARGVFNGDTDAVHINPDEIEDSTLIIGTHLIHISVLTEELYDVAMDTVKASGQTDIYYKSELGGGAWYMISDAFSLSDITVQDKKADNSVISGLYLRYHTKADGITYDLLKGEAVCMFDTPSPYEFSELSELDALNTQYENLQNKGNKTDTDKENINSIKQMLEQGDLLRDENAAFNKNLSDLNNLYIQNAENAEMSKVLQDVMKQIDCSRRVSVYQKLLDNLLPDLLKKVQLEDKEETSGMYVDFELIDAIGTAMDEVNNKSIECQGNALTEGDNALGGAKASLVKELMEAAENDDMNRISNLAENLTDLSNIESGMTVHPDREAALIKDMLLPMADDCIRQGSTPSDLEKGFAEGEFLSKAAASKMSPEDAKSFLESRIEELNNITEDIAQDALKVLAEQLKNESKAELLRSLSSLMGGSDNEMSKLLEEKQKLQTERLSALDENNLENAGRIENELLKLEEDINRLEQKLEAILTSETAAEADKAKARAGLQGEFAASEIEDIKEDILDDIENGQYGGIMGNLDGFSALCEISPNLTAAALKEIYKCAAVKLYLRDEQTDGQSLNTIMDRIEDLTAETATYIKDEPDKEKMKNNIEEFIGEDIFLADESVQAAAVAALCRYAENENSKHAADLAADLASDFYQNNNLYFYLKLKNEAEEFIPLDIAAKCCSYRYIFHEGNKTGILRKGTDYYEYSVFAKTVRMKENKSLEMNTYARYQSVIYLSSEYMSDTFQISSAYIPDTEYGILMTEEMENLTAQFLEVILNSTD